MGTLLKTARKIWLPFFLMVFSLFAMAVFSPVHADGSNPGTQNSATLKWVTDEGNGPEEKKTLQWVTDEEQGPEGKQATQGGQAQKPQSTADSKTSAKDLAARKKERIRQAIKRERILNYDISAVIDKDAAMTVTERITVNVENQKIRHGITRTYPIRMRDGEDGLYKFGFELLSTKLDGEDVDCKSQEKGLMVGMALGSAKTIVPKGVHTYEIVYKTTGHVRSLDDHDEIYYNAIGLDVVFPIDKASFSLTLPDGTKPLLTKAYTGKSGERGGDYRMTGNMAFATTRTLLPKEGFTVVVGWPKGVVTVPARPWINSHRNIVLLVIIGIVIAVLVIGWLWQFYRNRPPAVYPVFTPPEDLSPGEAAYINKRKYTPVMLQADLIWSAIKGFCRMDCNDPEHTVFNWIQKDSQAGTTQTSRKRNRRSWKSAKDLPGKIANALFAVVDKIVLGYESAKSKRPHSSLTSAWNNLYQYYKPRLKDNSDTKYSIPLAALVIGYLLMLFILDDIWQPGMQSGFSTLDMVWLPGIICGVGMILVAGLVSGWDMYRSQIFWRFTVCGIILGLAVLAFFVLWLIFIGDWIFSIFYWLLWMLPTLFALKWNSILNKEGLAERQTVEGLKMYINIAEKHRLELINAPEDNVAQYETILPYAIALDCADAWQKRYAPILSQLNYMPDWVERPVAMAGAGGAAWNEQQRLLYQEQLRNRMFAAMTEAPVSATDAIRQAIDKSQETKVRFSSSSGGWSSSGSSSGSSGSGSSGGGSGGGGVGGW